MDSRNREKFWNAANLITLARVALVPVFALMLLRGRAFGSLAVIFLAGLSDVLDGWVARTWHQRTKVGTLIDPLADKLLLSTAYVLLSVRSLGFARVIPVWLTAAVIGRDFIILAGGAVIFLTRGRREFPPSILGKMSTIIQVATVFWVVLELCPGFGLGSDLLPGGDHVFPGPGWLLCRHPSLDCGIGSPLYI